VRKRTALEEYGLYRRINDGHKLYILVDIPLIDEVSECDS
jgi:hypothetical protein